jgi:glycosyl transferase family 1
MDESLAGALLTRHAATVLMALPRPEPANSSDVATRSRLKCNACILTLAQGRRIAADRQRRPAMSLRLVARWYDGPVQRSGGMGEGGRPRILAVTDFFPWPPCNGGLLRTSTAVEALTGAGNVDLFSLYDRREPEPTVPPDIRLRRVGTTPYPDIDVSRRWRIAWLLPSGPRGVPMEVAMRRADGAPGDDLRSWLAEDAGRETEGDREADRCAPTRYDLVWFARATIFDWLGRPDLGPTVVDLHDLESDKEQRRAALMTATGGTTVARLRRTLARAQARLNARRWAAFERSVATQVDRVLLASADDAARVTLPHVAVVANTYRHPPRPAGKDHPDMPPTLLFQGTFDYAPNVDGAQWLVSEVGPRIRARMPGTAIRLAGRTTRAVDELHDPPDVVVVGQVPEMEPELARADVAVVPVRYASGTRLKILESFAHRLPVVTTTVGAEGLDVEDGVHVLVADGAEEFAAACARLVDDQELRQRMVDAAERRYLDRYESRVARDQIQGLVADLTAGG